MGFHMKITAILQRLPKQRRTVRYRSCLRKLKL